MQAFISASCPNKHVYLSPISSFTGAVRGRDVTVMICSRTLTVVTDKKKSHSNFCTRWCCVGYISSFTFRKNDKNGHQIHPYYHPSIHLLLIWVGPWEDDASAERPRLPPFRYFIQVFWGCPEELPGQLRDIFPQHDQVLLGPPPWRVMTKLLTRPLRSQNPQEQPWCPSVLVFYFIFSSECSDNNGGFLPIIFT